MPAESLRACHDAGLVWIAADRQDDPVGFLAAEDLDGLLFVKEISVHQSHQRMGLGRLLMQAAMDHARNEAYAAMALTTDRFIPFNAPFYERLGFAELPADCAPEGLKTLFSQEIARSFDPRRRILMTRPV
jgi:GNAT superfamily N-acetyltransferase